MRTNPILGIGLTWDGEAIGPGWRIRNGRVTPLDYCIRVLLPKVIAKFVVSLLQALDTCRRKISPFIRGDRDASIRIHHLIPFGPKILDGCVLGPAVGGLTSAWEELGACQPVRMPFWPEPVSLVGPFPDHIV